MRTDLKDTTFVIAVKLDSVARLENTLAITSQLCHYFDTNVIVVEIAGRCNKMLKSLLPRRVTYLFIEDKDDVFFRTKYFNMVMSDLKTPLVALWDSDVVVDKKAIVEAVNKIRTGEADIASPYNGSCLETSEIMRDYYLKSMDIRILHRNKNKLAPLYNKTLTGGAIIVDREKYVRAGMENETHYGWGNDDFDRFCRFQRLDYKIHRVDTPLFHIWHPRGDNSRFRSDIFRRISAQELSNVKLSSQEEIESQFFNGD